MLNPDFDRLSPIYIELHKVVKIGLEAEVPSHDLQAKHVKSQRYSGLETPLEHEFSPHDL